MTLDELCPPGTAVCAIVAHPDDESFCAGLICELVDRGAPVTLVCATRGEGGDTGGHHREQLGAVRSAELEAAAAALGVTAVRFVELVDPEPVDGLAQAPAVAEAMLAGLLDALLAELSPGLIVTHGSDGEYGHAAHLLLHRSVLAAAERMPVRPVIATMMAFDAEHPVPFFLNRSDAAGLVFDGAPSRARRARSIAAHASQVALFGDAAAYAASLDRQSYRIVQRGASARN